MNKVYECTGRTCHVQGRKRYCCLYVLDTDGNIYPNRVGLEVGNAANAQGTGP